MVLSRNISPILLLILRTPKFFCWFKQDAVTIEYSAPTASAMFRARFSPHLNPTFSFRVEPPSQLAPRVWGFIGSTPLFAFSGVWVVILRPMFSRSRFFSPNLYLSNQHLSQTPVWLFLISGSGRLCALTDNTGGGELHNVVWLFLIEPSLHLGTPYLSPFPTYPLYPLTVWPSFLLRDNP